MENTIPIELALKSIRDGGNNGRGHATANVRLRLSPSLHYRSPSWTAHSVVCTPDCASAAKAVHNYEPRVKEPGLFHCVGVAESGLHSPPGTD